MSLFARSIPDLSDLRPCTESLCLVRALAGGGSADQIAYTLQLNCVRILDASIRDYNLGSDCIYKYKNRTTDDRLSIIQLCWKWCISKYNNRTTGELGIYHIINATTHFESCIWHLERFIKHARALYASKNAEDDLKSCIPKTLDVFDHSIESRITRLRHTLAHLEKEAQKGSFPKDTSIALLPNESGLSIGNENITWQELSTWLRNAHSCISSIACFVPPKPASPPRA